MCYLVNLQSIQKNCFLTASNVVIAVLSIAQSRGSTHFILKKDIFDLKLKKYIYLLEQNAYGLERSGRGPAQADSGRSGWLKLE